MDKKTIIAVHFAIMVLSFALLIPLKTDGPLGFGLALWAAFNGFMFIINLLDFAEARVARVTAKG